MKIRQLNYPLLTILLKIYFFTLILITTTSVRADSQNLDDNLLALEGYDPVSYFSGMPKLGSSTIKLRHNNAIYYFETAENRHRFAQTPELYVPAYGGWCAWAMLDGEKVAVNPLRYKIINGKNYLFYDGFWGNTLTKWNKKADKTGEDKLVKQADIAWQTLNI